MAPLPTLTALCTSKCFHQHTSMTAVHETYDHLLIDFFQVFAKIWKKYTIRHRLMLSTLPFSIPRTLNYQPRQYAWQHKENATNFIFSVSMFLMTRDDGIRPWRILMCDSWRIGRNGDWQCTHTLLARHDARNSRTTDCRTSSRFFTADSRCSSTTFSKKTVKCTKISEKNIYQLH